MKMVWEAPADDWEEYIHTHMEAIRAKYFPKNAAPKVRLPLHLQIHLRLCWEFYRSVRLDALFWPQQSVVSGASLGAYRTKVLWVCG